MRIYIRVWSAIKVFLGSHVKGISVKKLNLESCTVYHQYDRSIVNLKSMIHANLEDLFSNFRPSVSTFNLNLPATEIHASNSTPSLSH